MISVTVRPSDLTSRIIRAFDIAVSQKDREVAELIARALEIHVTREAARGDGDVGDQRERLMDVRSRLLELRSVG